jgi:hypothetical protein
VKSAIHEIDGLCTHAEPLIAKDKRRVVQKIHVVKALRVQRLTSSLG